jgi:hypothetical protein
MKQPEIAEVVDRAISYVERKSWINSPPVRSVIPALR